MCLSWETPPPTVGRCLGGCPRCPSPSSVFVVSGSQPRLHARVASSQIVFFSGWRPGSACLLQSRWRGSCNLEDLTGALCPGSCSSVRSRAPNKHSSALVTLPRGTSFLTRFLVSNELLLHGLWVAPPSVPLHVQLTGELPWVLPPGSEVAGTHPPPTAPGQDSSAGPVSLSVVCDQNELWGQRLSGG